MIGVISSDNERKMAREFFELFKTPWEFYVDERYYDVVISTENKIPKKDSKLAIIYVSNKSHFDGAGGIRIQSKHREVSVDYDGLEIPIYCNLVTFEGRGEPVLRLKGGTEIAGLKIESSGISIILLGYNLFEEIFFLLSKGQPAKNALIPTLDIHISILRNLIINAGIPLVEVPPVPAGYDFIACLTHDIDFTGIRNHRFDHTIWGFLYRASIGSLVRGFKGKLPLRKILKNLKAALSLPFVYAGVSKDFWLQIDKYKEIEKNTKSTFFLIPFKDTPGDNITEYNAKQRCTKYDISDIGEVARTLLEQGFEIGVHGIDAWHSVEKARQEFDRIAEFNKGSEIGVRIHWLFFNGDSYQILDDVGFSYDSTCGYNDTVGYRAGTAQVFKPFGTKKLLEIPLNIQDTALFFSRRMNLSERKALEVCKELITKAKSHGGVFTILWHDRSLAPERLWGDFYIDLLGKINENKVWFATAGEIVNWFRKRREVTFEKVNIDDNKIRLSLKYDRDGSGQIKEPFVFARIYQPKLRKSNDQNSLLPGSGYMDIPLMGKTSYEINLNALNP